MAEHVRRGCPMGLTICTGLLAPEIRPCLPTEAGMWGSVSLDDYVPKGRLLGS